MSQFNLHRPFGPPIGMFPVENEIVKSLNSLVDSYANGELDSGMTDFSQQLAGEVSGEIRFDDQLLATIGIPAYLERCVKGYVKAALGREVTEFRILDFWVVRQFAGDYNPTHWHGGHISGAGWIKLPETMSQGGKKGRDRDGAIVFTHGAHQFLSASMQAFSPAIGTLSIFPHYLMHHVYPFSVEGERRSFAFNSLIDDEIFNVYEGKD